MKGAQPVSFMGYPKRVIYSKSDANASKDQGELREGNLCDWYASWELESYNLSSNKLCKVNVAYSTM